MGETIFSHAKFAFSSIFFSLVKIQPYLSQVCSIFTRQEIIPKHQCAPPADFAFVRSFFFVSVRRWTADPISIQPHLAFISKWWRGTMVALFSVPLFFLLPFFLHQSSSSLIRQTALHIWLHSATRDIFFSFFLWLIKEGFLTTSLFLAVLGWCIETHNNVARYNLIDTKYHQMALKSVPSSNLLKPLVKQKWVVHVTIFQKLLELGSFDFKLWETSEVWNLQSWNGLNLVFLQCLVV